MSYMSIYQCANDASFQSRLIAAAAQEGEAAPDTAMRERLMWPVSTRTDIEAAYGSALNAGNPNPGGDPTVITDAQILSAVQSILNPPTPPPPPPPDVLNPQ